MPPIQFCWTKILVTCKNWSTLAFYLTKLGNCVCAIHNLYKNFQHFPILIHCTRAERATLEYLKFYWTFHMQRRTIWCYWTDDDYSSFPNKRAYARSCSKGNSALCTSLLGTMHAPYQLSFGAKRRSDFCLFSIFFLNDIKNSFLIFNQTINV